MLEFLFFILIVGIVLWVSKTSVRKADFDSFELYIGDVPVDEYLESIENPTKICSTNTSSSQTTYRPSTFDEYIGQEKIKKLLSKYIKASKEREFVFPHLLISGKAGMGKTTLVQIIAKKLGVKVVETITSEIVDTAQVLSLIESCEGGIVFLDEIHSISRDNAEKLYTIMEPTLDSPNIPPFTLVGATTELGEMIQTRKPLVDRFKIQIELEDYTFSDLTDMSLLYQKKLFPNDILKSGTVDLICYNCRNTPRKLIRLLEATVYFNQDIKEVLNCFNIIKNGFTYKDLEILKYLTLNDKGIGLQGLAAYLDTSQANYLFEVEPYLLKQKAILRTPRGRKITEQGVELIKELNCELKIAKE